jgi:hypothetical protein
VAGVNSAFDEYGMSLTRDERIAFVGRYPPGDAALRMSTRASIDDDFTFIVRMRVSPSDLNPALSLRRRRRWDVVLGQRRGGKRGYGRGTTRAVVV